MEPLEEFFSSYAYFTYNPNASATKEFKRLCNAQEWSDGSRRREEAYSAFREALVQQFNTTYGTDINDLNGWHALMSHLGIDPLPDSVKECKKIVKGLYVNLVDLVDARGDPKKVVSKFGSEKELSKYTKKNKKFFPKDSAKAGGILKFLLRQILRPSGQKG